MPAKVNIQPGSGPAKVAIVQSNPPQVFVRTNGPPKVTVTAAERGPPGPPGRDGAAGAAITLLANGPLGGHRVVMGDGFGNAVYADSSNVAHRGRCLGITQGAAVNGDPVFIQVAGVMTEGSWNWAVGEVYLGANGLLTQQVPTNGFTQVIAIALSPTQIAVNIQPTILLA